MERKLPTPVIIGLVVAGILACSVFIYFQFQKLPSTTPPPLATDAPDFEPAPVAEPTSTDPETPDLEGSDEFLRTIASRVSEHPRFTAWIAENSGLVRRFVAAVDNVARGESPRAHLGFLAPQGSFRASEDANGFTIDPRSFGRYDILTEVVISLETAEAIRVYDQLEPLFDEAYRELGYPDKSFTPTFLTALDHVLETPIPPDDIALERRLKSYHYEDPNLESLSDAQKHYLRFGADNIRQLHAKLRLLRTTF